MKILETMEVMKHFLIPDMLRKKIDNPWRWFSIFVAGVNFIVLLTIIVMNRSKGRLVN